ncbi:MAG TPA: hypothetical protein ENK87_01165 [Nitratifractor sp.]|nr:hypothetical protein [Nitratifractor sp.]
MKLGYKIIIALLLIVAIILYSKGSVKKEQERYIKRVSSLLTDIRRRDYFAFHNELLPQRAQQVSIEKVAEFMGGISIKKSSQIELKSIEENNNSYKINGIVVSKESSIPFEMQFKESNNTLLLEQTKVGNSSLEDDKGLFPMDGKK